ncbi:CheY-like chemotaxis protein [Elusimicrobium simillimum]
MKKEDLPRLFTAFEQFDKVKNKKVTGTGLGLAITKRLAELMGGNITVTSEYGKGSEFTIHLPLASGKITDVQEENIIDYEFTATRAKVLLVDDIDINLMVAESLLEEYGIQPDTALNGVEALELVKKNDYDLIFMDHMMPEMDGVEATKNIRAMEGKKAFTPVVALTANAVSGAEDMFLASGFNGFLSKPIDKSALAACLVKWLPQSAITYLKR